MFFFGVSVQQVQEYLSLPCCHLFLSGRRIPEGIIVFLNQTIIMGYDIHPVILQITDHLAGAVQFFELSVENLNGAEPFDQSFFISVCRINHLSGHALIADPLPYSVCIFHCYRPKKQTFCLNLVFMCSHFVDPSEHFSVSSIFENYIKHRISWQYMWDNAALMSCSDEIRPAIYDISDVKPRLCRNHQKRKNRGCHRMALPAICFYSFQPLYSQRATPLLMAASRAAAATASFTRGSKAAGRM